MNSTRFDDLCAQVCSLLDQPGQPLPAGGEARGLELAAHGARFKLLHFPQAHPDRVCMLVSFGVPSPAQEMAAMLAMMEANFSFMTHRDCAAYSRNEATGELLLQYSAPLIDANAREMAAQMAAMAPQAAAWPVVLAAMAANAAFAQ